MTLAIRDGWPYRQPDLGVKGMRRPEHADAEGNICLWQTGDPSRQWMTLDGWRARVAEWRNRQTDGFDEADAVMDELRQRDAERMDLEAAGGLFAGRDLVLASRLKAQAKAATH